MREMIGFDNVSFQDLENVISFMYNGETAISQEDFNSFMRAAQRLRVKGLSEQYCKEVPGDQQADRAERRGPRRARYKSVIKKEEPFEPVKYLNVVDALARSMKTLDTDNDDEEGQSSQSESLFMEYEQYPVARINDIINIENRDEGGEEENENDEEDKEAKEEDVNEDGDDDDVEEKDEDDEDEQKEPIAEIINNDQVYEDDIDGEEDEEYLEDYHYQDWGVDRVDLDFKSGNINDSARDGDGECITWHLPPKLPWLSGKYKVVSIKFKHRHYSKEHFHS